MKIYSDLLNEYKLLDYSPTHSQLLLRSMRNKSRDYNIDIIIQPVYFVTIPATIKGIEISLLTDNNVIQFLITTYGFDTKYHKIFSLNDAGGKTFYINASVFGVYHNHFDILETSLNKMLNFKYREPGEPVLLYD